MRRHFCADPISGNIQTCLLDLNGEESDAKQENILCTTHAAEERENRILVSTLDT